MRLSRFAQDVVMPHMRLFVIFATVVWMTAPQSATAQYTWNVDANGNWGTPGNWTGGSPPPNAAGATVTFGTVATAPRTVTVDGTYTVGTMTFNGFVTRPYTLSGPGGLTLNNNGSNAVINVADFDGRATIAVPLVVAGTNQLDIRSSGSPEAVLTVTGPISGGSGGLRVNTSNAGGTVVLAGANTYTGGTEIHAGVLQANFGAGIPTSSNLKFAQSGVLQGIGNVTIDRTIGTGAGQIQWGASAYGGFSASNGTTYVQLNNMSELTWGSAAFIQNNSGLVLGSRTATGVVDFRNGLNLGAGVRNISVNDNTNSGADYAVMSGVIRNGSLTVDGTGTLVLAGANTYTGATTVNGVLRATDGFGLPTQSNLVLGGVYEGNGPTTFTRSIGTGAGQVRWAASSNGGFSAYGGTTNVHLNGGVGTLAWSQANFVASGQRLLFGSATATGLVDFQNGLDLGASERTISVRDNPFSGTDSARISGVISNGSLTVTSSSTGPTGTLELTANNTYSGSTTVSGGVLRANSGAGLPSASNLSFSSGGVLEGIGTATFSRSIGTGAGQVQWVASNSGGFSARDGVLTVQLNGGGSVTMGQLNTPAALLFGSTTANNVVDFQNDLNFGNTLRSITVADNPYSTSDYVKLTGVLSNGGLTKLGAGTLEIGGASPNTNFDGKLDIYEGTLVIGKNGAFGTNWTDSIAVGDNNSNTTTASALLVGPNITLNRRVTITLGKGAATIGASGVGPVTFSQSVGFARPTTITSPGNTSANAITFANDLTGSGAITIDVGQAVNGGGHVNVTGNGSGHSGTITVTTGTLNIVGANGRLGGTSAIIVGRSGGVEVGDSAANLNNRIGNRPVTLDGGLFLFRGTNGAASTLTTTGALTIRDGGRIAVTTTGGTGGTAAVTFGSLVYQSGSATFSVAPTATESARLFFTTAPTLTNNIIGTWATTSNGKWATYNQDGLGNANALGLQSVAEAYYTTAPSDAQNLSGNANWTSSFTAPVTSTATVASLQSSASNGQSLPIDNGGTLSITTGNLYDATGSGTRSIGGTEATPTGTVTTPAAVLGVNVSGTGILNVNAAVTGTGGLTKYGDGVLDLRGSNTYEGATAVNAGTLKVNGTLGNGVGVSVNDGGTLGGSGTINQPLVIESGGKVTPGNSVGTITVNGNVEVRAGANYTAEIGANGASDRIDVTGAGNTLQVFDGAMITIDGTRPSGSTNFHLVTMVNGGSILGNNGTALSPGFVLGSLLIGEGGTVTTNGVVGLNLVSTTGYLPGDQFLLLRNGDHLDLSFSPGFAPVPEPGGVLALAVAGLGSVGLVRRRRTR